MNGIGRRTFLAGFAAATVTGCSRPGTASPLASPSSTVPSAAAKGLPDADTMMGWIEEIVSKGVRRPGYDADEAATDRAIELMRSFGLTVRAEPVDVTRWEPTSWSLTVRPADGAEFDVACWPLPFAAPSDGREFELVGYDDANPSATLGRAALMNARLVQVPPDAVAALGSAPAEKSGRIFDPDGSFEDEVHTLPHTAGRNRIADGVFERGAAAFIGSLVDHPIDAHRYYVPYHGEALPGPGVWVSGSDGQRLEDLLQAGPVRVRIHVESTSQRVESRNVIGELGGVDDDIVMVGSHHDGPWASAVEDASGTALVLAQAAYWASVPQSERPHRLRFVLHAGHMCGATGHKAFVVDHADDWERTVVAIHLEHAALETDEATGHTTMSPRCTPRWFFTSRLPALETTVSTAIAAADLRRSMLVAPDAFGRNPPTDAGGLHRLGVPIVQFLAAPWYLFDSTDTIDHVDRDNLVPIGRAVVDIISSTAGVSPTQMRQG